MNISSSAPLGASTATELPSALPSAVHTANAAPILASTFPNRRCATSAAADGGSITSSDVPSTAAWGRGDASASAGVTIVPPPMPRSPEARPAARPMAASCGAAARASKDAAAAAAAAAALDFYFDFDSFASPSPSVQCGARVDVDDESLVATSSP